MVKGSTRSQGSSVYLGEMCSPGGCISGRHGVVGLWDAATSSEMAWQSELSLATTMTQETAVLKNSTELCHLSWF